MSEESMLAYVLARLPRQGDVTFMARLEQVSKGAAVPIHTVLKIAKGETEDPRTSTVQSLYDYFRAKERAAA